jgi:hypothetical protein
MSNWQRPMQSTKKCFDYQDATQPATDHDICLFDPDHRHSQVLDYIRVNLREKSR